MTASPGAVRIGTAGWSLPRDAQPRFPGEGSHLERYARVFAAAEINTTFYRPHRPSTYARWRDGVPPGFRFSVKLPKTVTHALRLHDAEAPLDAFLAEAAGLEDRLGCLLVQLPPSLAFDVAIAAAFFSTLRARTSIAVACEPRHPTWFDADADALLAGHRIARVAADPARVPAAGEPGGWPGVVYHRLHGSPRVYYSAYDGGYLDALAARVRADAAAGRDVWCVFDNTASGAATLDALGLLTRLHSPASG